MSIYQNQTDFIKYELLCCWLDCKSSHDSAMKDEKYHESATTYALSAQSHLSCIKSVYVCNYSDLANDTVETLIHQLTTFIDELLTNYCTDHSHQWTDLEFDRLHEVVSSSNLIEV